MRGGAASAGRTRNTGPAEEVKSVRDYLSFTRVTLNRCEESIEENLCLMYCQALLNFWGGGGIRFCKKRHVAQLYSTVQYAYKLLYSVYSSLYALMCL